jgi:hypothetical protein
MAHLDENLNQRLTYLSSLKDGWYDTNQGSSIDRNAIEATKSLLRHISEILPEPSLFPSQDGSISVEWHKNIIFTSVVVIDVHHDHYDFAVVINGRVNSSEFGFHEMQQLVDMITKYVQTTTI